MDPLDFLTKEDLIRFFHCKKTEMSCMESPNIFLHQLRDHNLVPEKQHKKVINMKSKERRMDGVYQILDRLEKKRSDSVPLFWKCVFQNHMLQQYPVLRLLRNSLLDGSFRIYKNLPDLEDQSKEVEEKKAKKRKKSINKMEQDEQPGPSSHYTPNQEKPARKLMFREQCSLSQGTRVTPSAIAGKDRNKLSIRRQNTQNIIEDGYLETPRQKRHCVKKNLKVVFPKISPESSSSQSSEEIKGSDEEVLYDQSGEEEDGETEEKRETEEAFPAVFKTPSLPVTCGSVKGVLDKYRFVSGPRRKSIRTEERWFTPEEFVRQETTLTDGHWKKDIRCHDKTLNYLLKKKVLVIHSLLCVCRFCSAEDQDLDNDDECFICDTEGDLVCCDECPRAFHRHCHLPAIQDDTLGEKWTCTFCVLKITQRWWRAGHMTEEEALKSPISQYTLHCQYLLLWMYKEDRKQVFTEDPIETVSDYNRVILEPMWMNRVKERLQSKEYQTLGQFVSDIRLIFHNCHIFNRGNEFDKLGSRLREMFEREFKTIFNIQ